MNLAIYSEIEERGEGTNTLNGLERTFYDWTIEGMARVVARSGFKTIFRGRLGRVLLEKLEDVIFGVVYPTIPDPGE